MALGMRKFCFIAGLALVAAPYSFAQKSVLPERFGSWEPDGRPPLIMWPRNSERAALDSNPEYTKVLIESGVVFVEERGYRKGSKELEARSLQLRDPSDAYEVYTSRLTPEMHPSTVWGPSGIEKGHLLLLIGNVVVEIAGPENASTSELQQFAKAIQAHSDQSPLPPIRSYLPEGLSDGTQRYSLGPAGFRAALERVHRGEYSTLAPEVGFENGAEVMLAEYRKRDDSAVLVLIEYPTPQLAEQHMHHLQTILPGIAKAGEAKIERTGSLLSLVLGATSPAYAASLRSAINYETQVTWNEPTHTLTDPPWLVIVSRIFTATGIFLVIAIVLGVAFGGLRVVTKRLFPGKVFDRRKDIEVLQLGLSGKRVDSDFS